MKNKGLISLMALTLSASSYATDLASRHYEFEPNQAKILTNPFVWQLSMKCKLVTKSNKNVLTAVMLKHSGKVNNHALKEGQHVSIKVKNNDDLTISVDASAEVEITNHGSSTVVANCEIQ
ncbi:hypothetical protein ACNVED_07155 [Legionella sp. D16C41]|uniref:hypothetical protein n=1 Tax=Legionella sp. D16C41 TaxID=3402688 RepID=UPI003AF7119B